MDLLQGLRDVYSLDTLDTRFVIPATAPPKEALAQSGNERVSAHQDAISKSSASGRKSSQPSPSKWNNPEFYLYYAVIGIAVPLMCKTVYDQSKETSPNYEKFAPLLSEGWIPGRKVDNSDAQYASFRNNVPYLLLVILFHPLLRRAYDYICRADSYTQVRPAAPGSSSHLTQGLSQSAAADARLEQRISFDVFFAAVFIIAMHGVSALKITLILWVNYKIATTLPRSSVPVATWVFNIGVLFANELGGGYRLAGVGDWIFPAPAGAPDAKQVPTNWGAWLDGWGGIMPRWEVQFNITILRLISFNFDYYWSLNNRGASPIEKKQLDPSNLSERDRVSISAKAGDFSFRNYFAYSLYSPLYLAGPIVTFNDYISQARYRSVTISTRRTILYAVRFLLVLLCMEVLIHFCYAVAISKANPDWSLYTPAQLSMLGYFNLKHIWFKLLIPWRFFRLWGLIDGVDSPENMTRCMSDNYSALAFWRGWHRSLNRWIVRYIYIPLGGSGATSSNKWVSQARAVLNYVAVFTFVALWHDIQLRLLMWGWLIILFILPEMIATLLFYSWRTRPTAYRLLCGVGAAGNILMMMIANLVGFAVGLDGLSGLLKGIVGTTGGLAYLAIVLSCLFVGSQVMFEHREAEARKGIRLKC